MEQIEEGLYLAVAATLFCFALSCLFKEQKSMMEFSEQIFRNYHQEALIEEIWYE